MPFCRKCGRRLPQYSESCPECGTSTTGPLIKIKKVPPDHKFKAAAPTKIAKAIIPTNEAVISVKTINPTKPAKTSTLAKTTIPAKPIIERKSASPTEDHTKHEIIKNNLSLEEDIITNPHDYETQTFDFDLSCPHDHFFPAGKLLPVSNGKAYCPECGEQLRKTEHRKHPVYHRF
jgi:hypothetical protein